MNHSRSDRGDSKTTVIRRRGGVDLSRHITSESGERRTIQMLDAGLKDATAAERVRAAAGRMQTALGGNRAIASTKTMRDDQASVFADFAAYLAECATALEATPTSPLPFARVVQPPRTGKTIIMGEFLSATGATAVVLVPSETLIHQTVRSLREQLPTVNVGAYYGEEKNAVRQGVVVATYQIVQMHLGRDILPDAIRNATFVFCDEGHKAMSDARLQMLREAFQTGALRIFFTATPDYNEVKTLASVAPRLIHEITVGEAMELKLFAKLEVQVVSVRGDGSRVKIVGKDFDHAAMGEVMSTEPFFEAVRAIRWHVGENAKTPALLCCASKAQAKALHAHLSARLPKGAPEPALILGDTKDREGILERFEAGEIDTLINVGVLIEGWNSPRCKLEIDLDPSLSEVRAKQKYFRVMTRHGDAVARIYVLVPEHLERIPIFPQTLFGLSVDVEGYAEWIGRQRRKSGAKAKSDDAPAQPREKPERKSGKPVLAQVLYAFDSENVRLNPRDLAAIRGIIETQFVVASEKPLPKFGGFAATWFETELFAGYGAHLLRYCGVPMRRITFLRFLQKLYPDVVADRFLQRTWGDERIVKLAEEDANYLATAGTFSLVGLSGGTSPLDPYAEGYDLEDAVDQIRSIRRIRAELSDAATHLSERQRYVLNRLWGEDDELTFKDVGHAMGLSGTRVSQIAHEGVCRLRELLLGRDPR